jgi:hypothetical protein
MAKTYDEWSKEKEKEKKDKFDAVQAAGDEAVASYNKQADQNVAEATADIEEQKKETAASYEERYSQNAVQQLVNERYLQERMANLGLTDSGLNRTQMTALQLQRGRADYETGEKKRGAIQSLEDSLAEYKKSVEADKAENKLKVENSVAEQQAAIEADYKSEYQKKQDAFDAAVTARTTALMEANPDMDYVTAYKRATSEANQTVWGQTKIKEYGSVTGSTVGDAYGPHHYTTVKTMRGEDAVNYAAELIRSGVDFDAAEWKAFGDALAADDLTMASIKDDFVNYALGIKPTTDAAEDDEDAIKATPEKLVALGLATDEKRLKDAYNDAIRDRSFSGSYDDYIISLYTAYLDSLYYGSAKPEKILSKQEISDEMAARLKNDKKAKADAGSSASGGAADIPNHWDRPSAGYYD